MAQNNLYDCLVLTNSQQSHVLARTQHCTIVSGKSLLPQAQKVHSLKQFREKNVYVMSFIGNVISFHLSKGMKRQVLHTIVSNCVNCNILVRLQGKFDIDHSWE